MAGGEGGGEGGGDHFSGKICSVMLLDCSPIPLGSN